MSQRRAALYLQIPAVYCRAFGGLRWAQYGDAVEFLEGPEAGQTFAFAAEISLFLEGLMAGGGPCPAFGTVLHLMFLLGMGDRGASADRLAWLRTGRIASPFRRMGNPIRNAGALFSHLLRNQAGISLGVSDPPDIADVLELLNGGNWIPQMVLSHPMLGAMDYAEQPSASAGELESIVSASLEVLSDEAIRHWLRFGRGPMEPVAEVAVPLPPVGLAEALAQVESRPRLAGLTRLVNRLDGALGLPPRRLDRDGPQTDGYWDLATRGQPEQILPIQFALEEEEFLRRFAERELLYYHRERPTRPTVQELVLILDQGVRTWGDVRLVLAGAAMAMVRQAGRRRLAVRIVTTGRDGDPVDPVALDAEAFGAMLEASDLSPNPSRALGRILRADREDLRDVVLLTHPRSLIDREVVEAGQVVEPGGPTRLFAVAIDDLGEVELSELRRGRPVGLSRSRVDLSGPKDAPRPISAGTAVGPRAAWSGEVESIPMPFRCGLLSSARRNSALGCRFLDFDEAGERVLIIMRHRLLYTFGVDGGDLEILPRPMAFQEVIPHVPAVIGVAGGFVLIGDQPTGPVLFHYDFATRNCRNHRFELRDKTGPISWTYHPDLHTIVGGIASDPGHAAIDLAPVVLGVGETWRAKQAIERARRPHHWPLPGAVLYQSAFEERGRLGGVALDRDTGSLLIREDSGQAHLVTPTTDGRPSLRGARVSSFQRGGDVLAVQVEAGSEVKIWFVSIARSAVIGSFSATQEGSGRGWFALARDGRRFARRVGDDQVEVRDVPGDLPRYVTPREPLWNHFASLGRSCLLVRELDRGGVRSAVKPMLIRWDGHRLSSDQEDSNTTFQQLGGVVAESRGLPPHRQLPRYDHARFTQMIDHGSLRILIDQYNHLAVLDRGDRLIAMFYVSGCEFAAWMPDGTCLGSRRLIGGEPTKAAAERIAATLRRAERGEGGLR